MCKHCGKAIAPFSIAAPVPAPILPYPIIPYDPPIYPTPYPYPQPTIIPWPPPVIPDIVYRSTPTTMLDGTHHMMS